tara:strand:+ start:672 stop:830 length:159 start_codon:yes stop_codon:yes gene_type:complete
VTFITTITVWLFSGLTAVSTIYNRITPHLPVLCWRFFNGKKAKKPAKMLAFL